MNFDNTIAALQPILMAFEQLGIPYYLGGSVVSSAYGVPRATLDVDIIADLRLEHVRPLVGLIQSKYYVDEDMIRDAIKHRASFNVLYLDFMFKVDVFILKSRQFDQEEQRRARLRVLVEGIQPFYMASPEDIILHKLEWYRMGNEVSDRQWDDILGVLKTRGAELDVAYLQKWAAQLQVTDLLEKALSEAGLTNPNS